ncbi:MAG TPA: hypothetical protein VGF30_03125 [Bacteroidia bacterium]
MKKFSFFTILTAIVLGGIMIFSNSCNKPKPCKAVITVRDTTGANLEAGVTVKLYAQVTTASGTVPGDLEATGTTDGSGQVSFTLKLPAIMDIRAEKPNCTVTTHTYTSGGTLIPGKYCTGKAIIKFEEGKTNEKTVFLKY